MVDIRAETVADAFFSGWIARYGTPATITTDRGAQFESKLWDSLWIIVESYHELSPSVEWHGRTFPPSIESRHYGARVTEPVNYHVTCCTFRSSFSREREPRQVSCRDDLRDNP